MSRHVPTPTQLAAQRHAAEHETARALGLTWYKQFPGDLLSISRGWPLVAIGLFHALRDAQWDLGSIPVQPNEIRNLLRIDGREWRAGWPMVEAHFPVVDGRRRNEPLANERYEALGSLWQQRDAARIRHQKGYAGASADAYAAGHPLGSPAAPPTGDADARAERPQSHVPSRTRTRVGDKTKEPTEGEGAPSERPQGAQK